MKKDNRTYYDEFSKFYEKERYEGYHKFVDDMEAKIAAPFCLNREVLEAGCGTGLIMERLKPHAKRIVGFDLSFNMLKEARKKGLEVVEGDITFIPFKDETFDTVCSFKVISHLKNPVKVLRELSRITKPGGHIIVDFYNKESVRFLIRKFRPSFKTSKKYKEKHIHTHFYTIPEIKELLPSNLELIDIKGVRGITVVPQVLKLPVVGEITKFFEEKFTYSPLTVYGGFLVAILKKFL